MIGKLLYRYRTQFGHGFRTAWQRDVVRWRVLNTSPVRGLTDGSCEIHVLTCERDWLDLIWCLKSLFSVCEVRFRLCIHDDGSVRPEGLAALASHFPDARVICRSEADEVVGRMLRDHPRCNALRRSNNLALKVFDFLAYLESDRLFLLDFGHPVLQTTHRAVAATHRSSIRTQQPQPGLGNGLQRGAGGRPGESRFSLPVAHQFGSGAHSQGKLRSRRLRALAGDSGNPEPSTQDRADFGRAGEL